MRAPQTATLIEPKPWKDVVLLPFSDRFTVYVEGPWFMGYLLYRYGSELYWPKAASERKPQRDVASVNKRSKRA